MIGRTTGTTGATTTYTTGVPATTTFTTGGTGAGYGVTTSTGSGARFGTTTGTTNYGVTTGATNYGVTTGATNYGVTTGGYGVTTGRTSGSNVKFGYAGGAPATTTYTTTATAPAINTYNAYSTGNTIVSKPLEYRVGNPITTGTYTTTEGNSFLTQSSTCPKLLSNKYAKYKQYPNPSQSLKCRESILSHTSKCKPRMCRMCRTKSSKSMTDLSTKDSTKMLTSKPENKLPLTKNLSRPANAVDLSAGLFSLCSG